MRKRLQKWTVNQQYYWWEHVYKVECISVILLLTRLQNWTVYQQYYWWEYVTK